MSMHEERGIIRSIERFLGGIAAWSYRQRSLVLAVAACLVALSGLAARNLRMDPDLTHLLPSSFESVRNLETFQSKSYGVGYVSVVVSGGSAAERRSAADVLAPQIEAMPTIEYVDVKRPFDFFEDRALYYLSPEELASIRDQLAARRQWEVQQRTADLGLSDEDASPPSLSLDALREKYSAQVGERGLDSNGSAYFEDEASGLLVLLARPARRSSDVSFNDRTVAEVESVVDAFAAAHPGLSFELSGRYKKKAAQKAQIEADLKNASILATILMVLYVGLHFRRVAAVGLVFAPLLVGLAMAFGAAALLFGSLNLLTGFIGALLLGLGIDHGIHLVARTDHERAEAGHTDDAAIRRAFGRTGRAVAAAGLTTIVAFAGLVLSEFRAFREFGAIAALGLTCVIAAYVTVLPALLSFASGAPKRPREARRSRFATALLARARPVALASAGLLVVAATLAPRVSFDFDFASLEDSDLPAFQLDREVNRVLGRSQTPLVVLAEDAGHERAIVQAVRRYMEREGDASGVQMVLSLEDFVPTDSADKKVLLEQIAARTEAIRPGWLDDEQRAQRDNLLRLTQAEDFSRADLPIELRRQFQGRDGASSFVLVYPAISLSDGARVRGLAAELREIRLDDGRSLAIAGEAMILADVLDMVLSEGPVVILLTLAMVVGLLWLLLGSRFVIPCAAAASATLLLTAALMPFLGLQLNYLNLVMVPVLFGMAVDGAVHVLTHTQERGLAFALEHTGRAVLGATATTVLGFLAFALAHHPGLRSLGELAMLGLGVNLWVCLVALPAGLAIARRFVRPERSAPSTKLLEQP